MKRIRRNLNTFLISLILFTFFIISPSNIFAQSSSTKGLGCGGGFGPIAEFLCGLTGGGNAAAQAANKEAVGNKFNAVLGVIIGVITLVAGLWFLFQFIIGGLNYLSAGGDKHAVEAAQQRLQNAIVGLIIVIIATVVVGLFGTILGLDILNPGAWITTLGL
jgi:hypothetical protein